MLLAYGTCQSLKDIEKQMIVPTVRLEGDDCVGVLLTQPEYEKERKKCAGTWFAIPYVSEMGAEWFRHKMVAQMGEAAVKQLEEQGYDTDWFLHQLFGGYTRALFIDTGVGQREYFEDLTKKFAARLNMRYEARTGTLDVLRRDLERTKALARDAQT